MPPPPGPFTEVPMGKSQKETFPIGLWTQNLKSCIGIGVTAKEGRALAHFTSDNMSMEDQWNTFSGLISGWTNVKGYMSKPDSKTNTSTTMNKEALDMMDNAAVELQARLDKLVQGGTKVVLRSVTPGGGNTDNTMSIDGQNHVLINGKTP